MEIKIFQLDRNNNFNWKLFCIIVNHSWTVLEVVSAKPWTITLERFITTKLAKL